MPATVDHGLMGPDRHRERSEAIQQSQVHSGLLRRFAPRNDESIFGRAAY
jgi:hypothetical protein